VRACSRSAKPVLNLVVLEFFFVDIYRTFTLVFPLTYFPMLILGPDITVGIRHYADEIGTLESAFGPKTVCRIKKFYTT
jgi:hypothetical protein